ncbi:MAG: hypothetical protein ACUZ77_09920 [Candidatus Brocadiales bacterium]
MEEHLRRLMAQIETEQGLVFLKEALPHVEELQNIQAKLIRNFFNALCQEGFTKTQSLEIIKEQGIGINIDS